MVNIAKKHLDYSKQSAADAFRTTSKRAIQKTAEATGDLIGNKIADKILKVSKIRNKTIQKQLQISMIKKYLKKDINLKTKVKKLLMK